MIHFGLRAAGNVFSIPIFLHIQFYYKQEGPPPGNRKRHTARAVTCQSVTCRRGRGNSPFPAGGYPILSYPGVPNPVLLGLEYPILSYPKGIPSYPGREVPILLGSSTRFYPGGRGGTTSCPGGLPILSSLGTPLSSLPPSEYPWKGHGTAHWGTPLERT